MPIKVKLFEDDFEQQLESLTSDDDIKDIFKKANGIVVDKYGRTLFEEESAKIKGFLLRVLTEFVEDESLKTSGLTVDKYYELLIKTINKEDVNINYCGWSYKGHPLKDAFKKSLVKLYINDMCGNDNFQAFMKEKNNRWGVNHNKDLIDIAKANVMRLSLTKKDIHNRADLILEKLKLLYPDVGSDVSYSKVLPENVSSESLNKTKVMLRKGILYKLCSLFAIRQENDKSAVHPEDNIKGSKPKM